MCAELKLLDVTAQCLRRFVGIERNAVAGFGGAQNSTGRFRVSVADEQNRVLWNSDQAACENIGKRFWRHHSAGKRVNAAAARRRIVNGLAVQDKGRYILH